MGELILHYFGNLLQKEHENISLGFKPSGKLHLGSVLTLLQAFLYVKHHPNTSIEVGVMDLDYDNQRGNNFMPFMHATNNEGKLVKEITKDELAKLSRDITDVLGLQENPVNLRYLSEILSHPELTGMITEMTHSVEMVKAVKRAVFDSAGKTYTVPLTGICPECHHSNTKLGVLDRERVSLESACENPKCETEKYFVSLNDAGTYNIHYLVDPIRDLCVESMPLIGAHLFGGDYALPTGIKKVIKAQRVMNVMDIFAENHNSAPDIYVGPMLTWNGAKMGKSTSGVTYSALHNPKDWIVCLEKVFKDGDRSIIRYEDVAPEQCK